jgi:hypothetical protein
MCSKFISCSGGNNYSNNGVRTWFDWGVVPVNEKEALWELIKAHYVFPFEHEELDKMATMLTIGRAL